MTRKIFLPFFAAILALNANAQDSTRTFVVSGSVDGYYRYNFNDPIGGGTNNYTSFTNSQNSFELGMATLRADGTAMGGKLAATADLGFGRRAEEFSYAEGAGPNGHSTLASVKQLYVSYTPGKYITFTLGKWGTHVGYEVLDAYANRNYSMDYMFSYGPFSHTGFKAQYTKGNLGIMLGVANPTDNTTTTSTVKTLIAQISDSIGKFKAYLNYQGFFGSTMGLNPSHLKSANQIDLVATTSLNAKWSLGINGTVQFKTATDDSSATWGGGALYINYDPSTKIGWTLRGEYVVDGKYHVADEAYSTLPSKSLYDITLSMNYRVGSQFTLIPELRLDGANSADSLVFSKNSGTSVVSSNTTFTGLIAAIYKF